MSSNVFRSVDEQMNSLNRHVQLHKHFLKSSATFKKKLRVQTLMEGFRDRKTPSLFVRTLQRQNRMMDDQSQVQVGLLKRGGVQLLKRWQRLNQIRQKPRIQQMEKRPPFLLTNL